MISSWFDPFLEAMDFRCLCFICMRPCEFGLSLMFGSDTHVIPCLCCLVLKIDDKKTGRNQLNNKKLD